MNKRPYFTVAIALSASSFNVQADEFWASRLGGGPGDVLDYSIASAKYQEQTTMARVDAGEDGTYLIHADSAATVHMDESNITGDVENFDISDMENIDTETKTPAVLTNNGTGAVQVSEGLWSLKTAVTRNSDESTTPSLMVDHSESDYSVVVSTSEKATVSGTDIYLSARVSNTVDTNGLAATDTLDGPTHDATDVSASIFWTAADGQERQLQLLDNGSLADGDEKLGDSVFSNKIPLTGAGVHNVVINFIGTVDGRVVHRTSTMPITIGENRLNILSEEILATGGEVLGEPLEDGRYGIPIDVSLIQGSFPEVINTRAEIWAKDSVGNDVVVGWTGGLVKPTAIDSETSSVPFTFHRGWLSQGVLFSPPLSIRNIELDDIATGEQMLQSSPPIVIQGIPISEPLARIDGEAETEIEPEPTMNMLQGVHPSFLGVRNDDLASENSASGAIIPKVVALHGWCDVAMPVFQFGNIRNKITVYTPRGVGQSAHQYATDVAEFMQFRPGSIRGVVAHSHGGQAAASLLQFYPWLFADNAASKPPNVITMGTPFMGTSILRGGTTELFRAAMTGVSLMVPALGCPIPYDLFPATNKRWRDDIGWRARFQTRAFVTVHAGETAFDNEELCGVASFDSPLLFGLDPLPGLDDGVIALSDGVNFADGGLNLEVPFCHLAGFDHDSQLLSPEFIRVVEQTFFSDLEDYAPF